MNVYSSEKCRQRSDQSKRVMNNSQIINSTLFENGPNLISASSASLELDSKKKRMSFCGAPECISPSYSTSSHKSRANSNSVFANFVELANEDDEFLDDKDFDSMHDSLLRTGSRNSISTFKPTTLISELDEVNCEMQAIQNYQKPKFEALKRIDKPHSNRNSIACHGPRMTHEKSLARAKDLELKLAPSSLTLSPHLSTFNRATPYHANCELDFAALLRKKQDPKPPSRRNSRLTVEKVIKRGDFGVIQPFEGLKMISSFGLTYASQLLSIVVRSSSIVHRTGLLHADLSTDYRKVQDFVFAVTGETINSLRSKLSLRKQKTTSGDSYRNKASSAPSLALVSSTLSPVSKSPNQKPQNKNTPSAHFFKHRASTDSTDSGVGSQLDQSEERLLGSPLASNSSSSSSTESYYQNTDFIRTSRLNSKHSPTSPDSGTKDSPNNEDFRRSLEPLTPDVDFEFTLFHVGFDVLPCFTVLKGLSVDVHHFSMKAGYSAFIKVSTETGHPETGLTSPNKSPRLVTGF